jgi:hypothetical protein
MLAEVETALFVRHADYRRPSVKRAMILLALESIITILFMIAAFAVIVTHQPRSNTMSVQSDLDLANANLAAAQAAQQAAQAAFDAAQPHLTLWAEVEAEASKLSDEVKPAFAALVARGRALFGM